MIKLACNVATWVLTDSEEREYLALLSSEESTRALKFRFEIDRRRTLLGRLLILYVCRTLLNEPSLHTINAYLHRTDAGKPVFDLAAYAAAVASRSSSRPRVLHFNVSHHGDWVVIAASTRVRIGVDVMRYEPVDDVGKYFDTMEKNFTGFEWEFIRGDASDSGFVKLNRFYDNWSLKEAYVKATGTGIGLDLRRIDFRVGESIELIVDGRASTEWRFSKQLLDDEHVVSTAIEGFDEDDVDFVVRDADSLVRELKSSTN